MTTKRVKKMGKEEMKEMFDLVIYAFNQEPTAERQERFEKLLSHTQSYGFLIDEQLTSQVMATPFQSIQLKRKIGHVLNEFQVPLNEFLGLTVKRSLKTYTLKIKERTLVV